MPRNDARLDPERTERLIVWSLVTFIGLFVLATVLVFAVLPWLAQLRIDDCRRHEQPGSASWTQCGSRGSWFG